VKGRPYSHTRYEQHSGYKKGRGCRENAGKGHPKVLDREQEQRPDEQRLRQAMNNRNRLKTVACDQIIQIHSLSNVEVNCNHPEEGQ